MEQCYLKTTLLQKLQIKNFVILWRAYGAQDVYLTGNPQITFFKVVYRRHTNFSIEAIEQVFSGTADFGRKVTCTISRNGDLNLIGSKSISTNLILVFKLLSFFANIVKEVNTFNIEISQAQSKDWISRNAYGILAI